MPADAAASLPSVPELQQRIQSLEAELRARTARFDEASRREAAVTAVLQVINASPGNLAPVFDVMLEKATVLCEADAGVFALRRDDGRFDWASVRGFASMPEFAREPVTPHPQSGVGRLVAGETIVHMLDSATGPAYQSGDVGRRAIVELGGARTQLCVALRKGDLLLGAFVIWRREVRPFAESQIGLLQNFAIQAAIAIENASLLDEQREGLEQQTATADILRIISQSPTNVQPVLDVVAQAAQRFCGAEDVTIGLRDGEYWKAAAHIGPMEAGIGQPIPLNRQSVMGRSILGVETVQVADIEKVDSKDFSTALELARKFGWRAAAATPMQRDGVAAGAILLRRPKAGAFTERQIDLLQTFAAQAAIAFENVRLFTELRQRTDDLTESLEYQTATSEVLEVIGRSTSDIQPVLDTMLGAALRLCRTESGGIAVQQGDGFRYVAILGWDLEADKAFRSMEIVPGRGTVAGRALAEGRVVQVRDVAADPEFERPDMARRSHWHTALGVPLMRNGRPVGAIAVTRDRIEPFTERQISLVRTFADQAVIAMENARLLGELRRRTEDLTESLERQTATAEVLETINSSPGDPHPVFEAILAKAMTLCDAAFGTFARFDGQRLRTVATRGVPEAFARFRRSDPPDYGPGTGPARLIAGEDIVHDIDAADSDAYRQGDPARRAIVELGGARTVLNVALRKDGALLGGMSIYRQEVRPFTESQIQLLHGFAAQAVIAMENARLLGELHQRTDDLTESLEYQTAISELLEVISRSGSNVQPVMDTILSAAARLCGTASGAVAISRDNAVRVMAVMGVSPEVEAALRKRTHTDQSTVTGRTVLGGRVIHVDDLAADGEYGMQEIVRIARMRTALGVPLLRDGKSIGAIVLSRDHVEPFSERQIGLIRTFADQAVIAMENARLLGELRESLDQQTATSDVLRTISSSPANLEAVVETLMETVARLCRVDQANMFRYRDGRHHVVASHGMSDEARAFLRQHPVENNDSTLTGRVVRQRQIIHIHDVLQDENYSYIEGQRIQGHRTMLGIPLMAQDNPVGVFSLARTRVEPFTDKEIALACGFADQAVIAIENARLFEELTDRQAELRTTFDNMADGVVMFDADLKLASWNRNFQELLDVPDDFVAARPSLDDYVRLLVGRGEIGDGDAERQVAIYRERASGQWSTERTRPDGRVIEVRNNPVPGGGAVLIYSDITERKKAEAEITAARDAAEAALERQTATADILGVISQSPTDAGPVFDAIARNAQRLCKAVFCGVVRYDGELLHLAALQGFSPDEEKGLRGKYPVRADDLSVLSARVVTSGRAEHIDDILADAEYDHRHVPTNGFRRIFGVPMLRGDKPIGAIVVGWREQGATLQSHVDLLTTFAAQAVIAVENVRLFTELREALDRQTATADILKVIASSPADMKPAFDAIAANARRLLHGLSTTVWRLEGDAYRLEAFTPTTEEADRALREMGVLPKEQGDTLAPAAAGRTITEIPDTESGPVFMREIARLRGFRACLAVSLAVEGQSIGFVNVTRRDPGVFRAEDVELLKTFADQAVIAIENVRLFTELREALEQQTATAEILRVISQSPTDVQPVLDAVAKAAVRFCGAVDAAITLREGNTAVIVAHTGPLGINGRRLQLDKTYVRGRVILEGRTIHVPDLLATDDYPAGRQQALESGHRAVASAPLLREGEAIGCLTLRKPEPSRYADRQIELLEVFAAQAVIAIENVRLFTELRASLDQQTASAEILRVISESPTDVQPVLEAIARAAVKFCGAPDALIALRDGDESIVRAHHGSLPATIDFRRPITTGASGRAIREARTIQYEDISLLDPEVHASTLERAREYGFRATIAAPLLIDGVAIGAIVLRKPDPGPLTPRQVDLLESFAAQAVIAIRNVRLFNELHESLARLKAAQANLIQAEKMAALGQLTAGIAHEIKNPLNFVNNFAGLSGELLEELKEEVETLVAAAGDDQRTRFEETLSLLTGNLAKIVEHGRRADGIVKSMLAHSRGGTGDWQSSNINALVDEALNLAYHGARAQDQNFNVALERDFDEGLKAITVVPQDFTRVFLNLFANGFYATRERQRQNGEERYKPTLRVSTRDMGEGVEIRVRDNGIGIAPELRDKLFQPFFTTKPTGEGTGLGLSISYDIVTQQHGGSIEVESQVGQYTEFTVRLPRDLRSMQPETHERRANEISQSFPARE